MRVEKMRKISRYNILRHTVNPLLFLAVTLGLFLPLPTAAQDEFTLPFAIGPVLVSAAPGEGGFHAGPSSQAIDFVLPAGTTIYSTKPGVVIAAEYGWNDGYGNLVQVRHHDGSISLYAHLREIYVKVDQPVGRTTELGQTGNSGNVNPPPSADCPNCGELLHFEIRSSDQSEGVNVQYLVEWAEGCPGCTNQVKGTAEGASRQDFMMETFQHNSAQNEGVSTTVLDSGRSYLITIQGTFSFWPPNQWGEWVDGNATHLCWGIAEQEPLFPTPEKTNGAVGADSEYHFAVPIYPSGCEGGPTDSIEPVPIGNVQISLDAGAVYQKLESTNAIFSSRHKYQYLIDGTGNPLTITISDPGRRDNYGMLTLDIELYR